MERMGLKPRKSSEVTGSIEGGGSGGRMVKEEGQAKVRQSKRALKAVRSLALKVSKVMAWMGGGYAPKVHVPEAWSLV